MRLPSMKPLPTLVALLLAALLAAGSAAAAKRDLDLERLTGALDRLPGADAALAPTEVAAARAAVGELGLARGKDERAHALYLAERRVDIAEATIEAVQSERRRADLERERDGIMLKAAQRDAEQARLEVEKLRMQSLAQQEETERAQLESEQARAEAEQAKRLAEAQAEEMKLAKTEAQLTRATNESLRAELLNLKARRDERGLVMTLSDYVFDPGSAKLKPEVQKYLGRLIEFVNQDPAKAITIEGHTDNRGGIKLNRQLSEKRADAVRAALVAKGVSADRITVVAKADENPLAANETPEGRAKNRRVEIVVSN
jgi:outer membrane protein OmpA-like peptidoglycan-associated protein